MSISPPLPLLDGPPGWTEFFHTDQPSEPAPIVKPVTVRDPIVSPGSVFAGQWEVLRELGAGGMALVYKVYSTVERRIYAMKVLNELFAKDATALARFEHEFCTLKRLSHPHIVKADSFVAAKGEDPCFYTMEFLKGEPLDQLAKAGPLPVERAVQLTLQICDAVAALHEIGVLHRDIKPANIIVGRVDGRDHATLVDLGVCKWTPRYYADLDGRTPPDLRRETRAGTVLGTPGYMGASPDDDDAEFRDVFGLGATLFRIVTGRMPYKGEPGPDEVLRWEATDADLPGTLTEALEGALDASPSSRFQSIAEFREALELVVDELAMQVGKPDTDDAPVLQAPRPAWRSLFFGIGLGIGLGIGVGIGVGVSIGLGANDPASDGPGDVSDIAAEEHNPAPGDGEASSSPHGPDDDQQRLNLRLNNVASCVPPNSGDDMFVDLEIDEDGRLAGIKPGEGVNALTVACLREELGDARLSPGGQSTHRVLLTSFLRGDDEHDDD